MTEPARHPVRRDLAFSAALVATLWLFNAALSGGAPTDLRALASFDRDRSVGERRYHRAAYTMAARAGTSVHETAPRFRGDQWRLRTIPDDVYEPGPVRVDIDYDEHGFPNPLGQDRYAIACLGDSQTESGWPKVLGELLGAPSGNFGTPSMQLPYQLEILEDFVAQKRPRLVILGVFTNSIFDLEITCRQRDEGRLSQAPESVERRRRWEARGAPAWLLSSAPGRIAASFATQLKKARRELRAIDPWRPFRFEAVTRATKPVNYLKLEPGPGLREAAFMPDRLRALGRPYDAGSRPSLLPLLADFEGRCARFGARLMVVHIPTKERFLIDVLREHLDEAERARVFGCALKEMDAFDAHRDDAARLLESTCQALGLPFLDLTAGLAQMIEAGEAPWLVTDTHFGEAGNRRVAELIAAHLRAAGSPLESPRPVVKIGPWRGGAEAALTLPQTGGAKRAWLELELRSGKPGVATLAASERRFSIPLGARGRARTLSVPLRWFGDARGPRRLELTSTRRERPVALRSRLVEWREP
jgi:hypothetical protein